MKKFKNKNFVEPLIEARDLMKQKKIPYKTFITSEAGKVEVITITSKSLIRRIPFISYSKTFFYGETIDINELINFFDEYGEYISIAMGKNFENFPIETIKPKLIETDGNCYLILVAM